MFDGTLKAIQNIKKGDKIKLKNGKYGIIECLIRSKVFENV